MKLPHCRQLLFALLGLIAILSVIFSEASAVASDTRAGVSEFIYGSPMTVTHHPSPAAIGGGIVSVTLSWNSAVDLDLEIWDSRGERKLLTAHEMVGENVRTGGAKTEVFPFRKYGADDYGAGKYTLSVRVVDAVRALMWDTQIKIVVSRYDGTTEIVKAATNLYPGDQWHAVRVDAQTGTVENLDRIVTPGRLAATPAPPPATTPPPAATTPTAPPVQDLPELVRRIQPSVVLISTYDRSGMPLGQGTGFFVSATGEVVTNRHVMEDAAAATITTAGGKKYDVGGIIAEDRVGDIVKLTVTVPTGVAVPVTLTTAPPQVGEKVLVIGNPLGLEQTVSDGIVSAVRDIPSFGNIIQLTAPISHGSSGSPVVNMRGEVIGIATMVMTGGQNLNFAIPGARIVAVVTGANRGFSVGRESSADLSTMSAEALYAEGMKLVWAEDYARAVEYFRAATRKDPADTKAWFELGYCSDELGRYQEAIDSYKQAIRLKPDYAEAYNNLGTAYGNLGRYQEAIDACKQAIRLKPDDATAYSNLGVTYYGLGRYQEAIDSYKQAIRLKPDFAGAYSNLGVAYGDLGRHQEAIDSFKQAIRLKPDFAEAYYNLGVAYGDLGRHQEAIDSYKQAILLQPDYAEAYSNLGLAYGNLGRYQEEIESYKQAIRLQPDYATAYFNLGVAYERLGRHQEAIESYKQAIRLKPDYADAYSNLGGAYQRLGRYQEAIESYKQAIRLKPDHATAYNNLVIAYLQIGNRNAAIETWYILQRFDPATAESIRTNVFGNSTGNNPYRTGAY